jgi:integrase
VPRGISRVIGIMFEDARNIGLVESNPFSRLRLPATEKTCTITSPTMDEYRALLESCTVLGGYGPEFKAMLQFSAWTGVRAGELQALEWDDVHGETIEISKARKRDGTVGPPKNGKARTIVFLPPAQGLDDVPRRSDSFVFHSPRGTPLVQGAVTTTPGAPSGPLRGCLRRAGMTCATSPPRSCWRWGRRTSTSPSSSAMRTAGRW